MKLVSSARPLTLLALLAGAGPALAQSGSGVSITDNNITWTQANWQTSATATPGTTAWAPTVQPGALRVNDLPQGINSFSTFAHQNDWFYRFTTPSGGTELRERNFNNLGTPVVTGNTATWTFSLPNSSSLGGSLNATLTQTVRGLGVGTGQGRVDQTVTLSNPGSTDQTLALYNWAKFFAGLTASSTNNALVTSSGAGQRSISFVNSSSWADPVWATLSASGLSTTATNWQVDTFSTSSGVLAGLSNTGITALNGQINSVATTTGFVNNPQAALRFDLLVPAGGSTSVTTSLIVVPSPAPAALLGLGGLAAVRRRRR